MKTLPFIYMTLFIFQVSFGQAPGADEQTLLSLESKRLEAMVAHDHDFLVNLYDDQFHGVIASGHTVDKTGIVEFLESGSPHVVQSVDEVKARVFGTVGITTGKLVSKSKSGSVIGQSRFTHVYLRKNDRWKMIESQGTVIIQE